MSLWQRWPWTQTDTDMLHIALCLIGVLTDDAHGLGATGPAGVHTQVPATVTMLLSAVMDHLAPVAIIATQV